MTIQERIKRYKSEKLFFEGTFGIEKEGLRIQPDGKIAMTDHPSAFGARAYHPYVQTDYSESQLELVTPAVSSPAEMMDWLRGIQDVAYRTIRKDEWVWPFSMPPALPEESEIPIIKVPDTREVEYRLHLADKYGRKKQMISGIHFNFMFSKIFLNEIFQDVTESEKKKAQEEMVIKLAKNFLRYRWLLIYLFGASPVADESFFNSEVERENTTQPVRSLRNGPDGYTNSEHAAVRYESFESYVKDIKEMVQRKQLIEEREFYGSVRLRGRKTNEHLLSEGLQYFEFRLFDINPFSPLGVTMNDVTFIHVFLLYMVWMDKTTSEEELLKGEKMSEETAMEHPFSQSSYQSEGLALLKGMRQMVEELEFQDTAGEVLESADKALRLPERTRAAKILTEIEKKGSFLQVGLELAKEYKEDAWAYPYRLRGFNEMEMSTQLLIFDAIQKGVQVRILDKEDQFLELKHGDHVEYVKNGNMTSLDTYISSFLMGNKTVTKKVLREKGYVVPGGEEYQSPEEAKKQFWKFEGKQIVVKPKTTNYGVGISVFTSPTDFETFAEAINIAFQEDQSVLVEEFAHGTEYRFFVLDGKTEAVLLRLPANVKGDGVHTIQELIDEKNKHPYRGENHRAPLEKIRIGEIERMKLKEQQLTPESVPENGQVVLLRENSNISTGGDSIDFTDRMHESYKVIAAEIAKAVGANICGVDLMIQDYEVESTKDQPGYIALEANYNPAMHMHAYVYEGEGRRLTEKILMKLFPELEQ